MVFAIVNRYYQRPARIAAADHRGQAQLQYRSVKFATVAAVFWGGRSVFSLTAQGSALFDLHQS